jgi:Arc/MetJ-type ribon-helix-helix transcriptional regulator
MDGRKDLIMTDTEKITINLGPVDLGRIDLLVEQGVYSNRTDAIRTAIRNLLDRNEAVLKNAAERRSFALGALLLNRQDLLKKKREGKRMSLHIIGVLSLADDIEPELAREMIESIAVRGVFRASKELKEALSDRTH